MADRITGAVILVVEDIEETRDGIQSLLEADGYRVCSCRDEQSARISAARENPDLILVSLGDSDGKAISMSRRIRERAGLRAGVPLVVFCATRVGEGGEADIGESTHLSWPDNFDQLRLMISRLLRLARQ